MHPVLIEINGFFIGSYGVMIMLGLIAALMLALRRARTLGHPGDFYYDLAFVVMLAGLLGARILYVVLEFGRVLDSPRPWSAFWGLVFDRSGFVFLGGFAAAIPATIYFTRRRSMPLWEVADVGVPSLALAHAFGRIGCFLAGCCYGRAVSPDFPFGVQFPRIYNSRKEEIFSIAFHDHLDKGLVSAGEVCSAPVLPSQLFEAGANALICAILLLLWRRRRFQGQVFCQYLLLYGAARFGLEFLRGDAERGLWFGGLVSTSQILSLVSIAAGGIVWVAIRNRPPVPVPAPAGDESPAADPTPAARATRKAVKGGKRKG